MNEALASKFEKIVALGIALKNSKPIHTVDLRSDGNDLMGKNNSAGPPSKRSCSNLEEYHSSEYPSSQ